MIGRKKFIGVMAGLASVMLVAAACSNGSGAEGEGGSGGGGSIPLSGDVAKSIGEAFAASGITSAYGGGGNQAGLHVMGVGSVTVDPDLGILNMGVEARESTVEEARSTAAGAMNAVRAALAGLGVSDDDIKTQFFNIQPEYVWREVVENGFRENKQELVGYRVTNSIEVKIRDLEKAGEVIDAVATAGGDVIRINNIAFTVEDPLPFEMEARELAVKEARAKAEQMAGWAGATLGRLVFLSETSAPSPVRTNLAFAESADGAAPAFAKTEIAPGDLDLRVSVQAVWSIQ
ncbi:MAG: hypothetical protein C1O27_000331 [Chloroflexi bacterium]|nr:MAG: hypothetical protein C1O27_000331 [Chloroflexota bacterium]